MQIQTPKYEEEINIEISESGQKDESELKIWFDTYGNDDVEDISIYDTPFGLEKSYFKFASDISPKPLNWNISQQIDKKDIEGTF